MTASISDTDGVAALLNGEARMGRTEWEGRQAIRDLGVELGDDRDGT